jgi:hypothetical protein
MNLCECPACSSRSLKPHATVIGVSECKKCGAIFGQCYLGDSYSIVKPWFETGAASKEVYFDLETVGSKGVERRHGWMNPATKCITQVG